MKGGDGLTVLIGSGRLKKKGDSGPMGDGMGGAKAEAAQAVMDAVKGGDSSALADALETFVYQCIDEGDEGEESAEEDEEEGY